MEILLIGSWPAIALRGIAAIAFGVAALLWPGITLSALVLLFGAYSLLDGVLAIAAATQLDARRRLVVLALEGLVGIAIGFSAIVWTGMTALALVDLIASWAVLTGLLEIGVAVKVRRELPGEFLLGLAGATSILLGVSVLLWPEAGAFGLVLLLGAYAFVFGVSMLLFALRLRRLTLAFAPPHHAPRHRTA